MLMIDHGIVMAGATRPEELVMDVSCAIHTFIKKAKEQGMSDEFIEKTIMGMVVEGFKHLDDNKMFDINKEMKKRE